MEVPARGHLENPGQSRGSSFPHRALSSALPALSCMYTLRAMCALREHPSPVCLHCSLRCVEGTTLPLPMLLVYHRASLYLSPCVWMWRGVHTSVVAYARPDAAHVCQVQWEGCAKCWLFPSPQLKAG